MASATTADWSGTGGSITSSNSKYKKIVAITGHNIIGNNDVDDYDDNINNKERVFK